jgi:hypothetical protein
MTLGSTQPLTGKSARDLPWEVKADDVNHFHVPIVYRFQEPQPLGALRGPVLACRGKFLPVSFSTQIILVYLLKEYCSGVHTATHELGMHAHACV